MIRSVMIDNNEPDWVKQLKFNVPTTVVNLDTGDLWLSTTDDKLIIVERKEPGDLLNSVKDGRLFNQTARMRQLTPYGYVVITNSVHPMPNGRTTIYKASQGWVETGWEFAAIEGAKLTVQELGVHVVTCAGDTDFLPCMWRLAGRSRDSVPIMPVREANIFGGAETILSSLPGIGPKRALDLLKVFPDAATAIHWLTSSEPLEGVPGIGNGIQEKVTAALGGRLIYQPLEGNNGK